MTPEELEILYEILATRIDRLNETRAQVFLAKSVLLLANQIDDLHLVLESIESASQDLDD